MRDVLRGIDEELRKEWSSPRIILAPLEIAGVDPVARLLYRHPDPAQDVPERPMALVKTVRDDNQTTQTTVGALGDRVEDYTTRLPRGGLAEPPRVIQHPGGRPKAVAIQRCRTDRVGIPGIEDGGLDQDFEHTCDTEGGSSGSPVLDGSGRVIGLHHFGFTEEAAVRRNQAVLMQRVVASFPNDLKAGLVP